MLLKIIVILFIIFTFIIMTIAFLTSDEFKKNRLRKEY